MTNYHCFVRVQEAQPSLAMRKRTSVEALPQAMGAAYSAIMGYLAEQGATPAGPPFAAYHNMDMQELDVEIGFAVSRPVPGRDEIVAGELPAGRAATCVHTGSYARLGEAYEALADWMEEKGYEATEVAYEFYLNDPVGTPEEELEVQVLFPIKGS